MDEYFLHVKHLLRLLLFSMALAVLGWGFTTHQPFFAGLITGLLIGSINSLYTAYKVNRVGQAISQGGKKSGLGMATRFSLVALGALLVARYPDDFHVIGLVVGLFLPSVFAIGGAIYLQIRK